MVMTIHSTLQTLSNMAIVFVLVTASLGCETMGSMGKLLTDGDKPAARIKGVNLQDLTLDAATLAFDVEVANPYDLPLPLANLNYNLLSGGKKFVNGSAPLSGTIPAGGSRVVTLPASFTFADVMSVMRGISPGEVLPYTAELGLGLDAPGVGPLTLPLKKKGELPIPAVPKVAINSIDFENLSLTDASALVKLDVENTNQFAATLQQLSYGLSLGGYDIGQASIDKAVRFGKGDTETIEIPIEFSPRDFGMAAFNMLRSQDISYDINGLMNFASEFGNFDLPFQGIGEALIK